MSKKGQMRRAQKLSAISTTSDFHLPNNEHAAQPLSRVLYEPGGQISKNPLACTKVFKYYNVIFDYGTYNGHILLQTMNLIPVLNQQSELQAADNIKTFIIGSAQYCRNQAKYPNHLGFSSSLSQQSRIHFLSRSCSRISENIGKQNCRTFQRR